MKNSTQAIFMFFKTYTAILVLLLSSTAVFANVYNKSAATLELDPITAIPDANFEQALIELGLDDFADGSVLTSNIDVVTDLDVSSKGISDLTGIEDFASLQTLICSNNSISSLNVNGLTDLYYILCDNNALTSLNVSALTSLQTLVINTNSIETIDLSNNGNLYYLDCDNNLLTALNVSALVSLGDLYCNNNQLSSLNVKGLANLEYFECMDNLLSCILVDDVAAANTASITDSPYGSPFWKKDPGATYAICDCIVTTWTGASWDNGAPTITTAAVIEADYENVNADISACTLTINNDATVVIPSGFDVTLNASLIVEAGSSFTLSNNANLIQTTNATNTGDITVNRDSNSLFRLDYTMWSSPVSGSQTLANFSPVTSTNRFYEYNPATDLFSAVSNTSTFTTAKGYLIRMPNENIAAGYNAGTSPIVYSGAFTGVPNNGTVSLTGLTSDKYYAIGNPYPSAIDADLFISGNATSGTLYFWRKTNAALGTAYATYTLAGGAGTLPGTSGITPNGTIQVGQGFIAKTGIAATTLTFTNAMREAAPTSTQFFKTKKLVDRNRIWLNLTNQSGVFSQMLVSYMPNATEGFDAGIDGKYINDSKVALTSSIDNEEYTIQGRAPFNASDVVSLIFKTNVAGEYTIAIDHVDGLFAKDQDVYLVDNATGTVTDLKAGSYIFTAAAGVDSDRFSLKYQKTLGLETAAFTENNVMVYKNKGIMYVNAGATMIKNVKVFDIQGRLVAELKDVKSTTASVSSLKAANQVLIFKVTAQDNKVVSKKVLY